MFIDISCKTIIFKVKISSEPTSFSGDFSELKAWSSCTKDCTLFFRFIIILALKSLFEKNKINVINNQHPRFLPFFQSWKVVSISLFHKIPVWKLAGKHSKPAAAVCFVESLFCVQKKLNSKDSRPKRWNESFSCKFLQFSGSQH
jgi:hypothetical protein